MPDIAARVLETIQKTTGCQPEQLIADAALNVDLGLDSLQTIELVMEVERVFTIEISDYELDDIITVGDLIRCVKGKVT